MKRRIFAAGLNTNPIQMKKIALLVLPTLLTLNFCYSQTRAEIDSLLNRVSLTDNSKTIAETTAAKKIIAFGERALPMLSDFFSDPVLTQVKSECHERSLTKGEIAIILADHIDRMPYALLTGVQNCLLEFCEDNSNLVEYYLPSIHQAGLSKFKEAYINWLTGDWAQSVNGKKRRKREKIVSEWINASDYK